jgi:tetratricopeptide (TPR) repeat protein
LFFLILLFWFSSPLAYADDGPAPLLQTSTGAGAENIGPNAKKTDLKRLEQTAPVTITATKIKKQDSQSAALRMIVTDSENEAVDILSEIKRGKPFLFLAYDRSRDRKSAEEYGYMGEVDPLTLDPAVREALAVLEEGQASGIIRLGGGRYAFVEVRNNSFLVEGERAFTLRDYRNAESLLSRHLELNPDDIKARMMIAALYDEQKQPAKAEDSYGQAIFFRPKAAEPYERLGKLYLKQGAYGKARYIFSKGLKNTPSSSIFRKLIEITDIRMIGAAD